jgi:CubicO group peptidase (beta-lactamase class C family)
MVRRIRLRRLTPAALGWPARGWPGDQARRLQRRSGAPVLKPATVAEMTRDQLTAAQRANVWPGFSFLEDRGWGYGLSVLGDGRCTWEGGFGTVWSNVPSEDLTVVVLTQRAADETGMPAICDDVLSAVRGTA